MTLIEIGNIGKELSKAKEEYKQATELLGLIGKEGHGANGVLSHGCRVEARYEVAYQAKVGSNNYHQSDALNKEIARLMYLDMNSYVDKAIDNLSNKVNKLEKLEAIITEAIKGIR